MFKIVTALDQLLHVKGLIYILFWLIVVNAVLSIT